MNRPNGVRERQPMLSHEEIGDLTLYAAIARCGLSWVWVSRREIRKKPGEDKEHDERYARFKGGHLLLGIIATIFGVVQIVRILAKAF